MGENLEVEEELGLMMELPMEPEVGDVSVG